MPQHLQRNSSKAQRVRKLANMDFLPVRSDIVEEDIDDNFFGDSFVEERKDPFTLASIIGLGIAGGAVIGGGIAVKRAIDKKKQRNQERQDKIDKADKEIEDLLKQLEEIKQMKTQK